MLTNYFTVPPMTVLCPVGFDTNGCFQIQMTNFDNTISYILQCSTDCVNWTSLSTNSSGQPLIDFPAVPAGSRFYRVKNLQQ